MSQQYYYILTLGLDVSILTLAIYLIKVAVDDDREIEQLEKRVAELEKREGLARE